MRTSRGTLSLAAAFACVAMIAVCAIVASDNNDSEAPVELAPKAKACNSDCQAKKAAIAAQMKALRKQIMGDFSSMTHYGKEVGKIPKKTESIRDQVMDGSLLGGSSSGPPPPKPFKPDLAIRTLKKAVSPAAQKVEKSIAKVRKNVDSTIVKAVDKAVTIATAKPKAKKVVPAKKIAKKTKAHVAVAKKKAAVVKPKAVIHKAAAHKKVKKVVKHKVITTPSMPHVRARKLAEELGDFVAKMQKAKNAMGKKEFANRKKAKDPLKGDKFLTGYFDGKR